MLAQYVVTGRQPHRELLLLQLWNNGRTKVQVTFVSASSKDVEFG